MLLSPAYTDIFEVMSGAPEHPGYLGRVGDYILTTDPRWPNVQSPQFLGVNQPYQTTQPGSTALAPLGLNDESYMQGRPSPVLSHHSHEYQYVDNMVASQGIGVTSPYQSYIPALTPSPNLGYQAPHLQQSQAMDFYNLGSSHTSTPFQMDQSNTTHQQRQNSTPSTTVSSQRNSPVRILPHPDGLQRLEQGRRGGGQGREAAYQSEGAKPRPSGRSRRDPQAEEEDLFVENLRAQNLSWKIVAEMFRERYGKNTSEARLQMRMLRRRKSAAAWQEADNPQSREGHKRRQPDRLRIMSDTMKDSRSKAMQPHEQISSTSTTLTPEVALTHNRASRILDKTSTGWRDPHHSSFQSEKRKRRPDDDDNDEHEANRKRKQRTKTFQIKGDP